MIQTRVALDAGHLYVAISTSEAFLAVAAVPATEFTDLLYAYSVEARLTVAEVFVFAVTSAVGRWAGADVVGLFVGVFDVCAGGTVLTGAVGAGFEGLAKLAGVG